MSEAINVSESTETTPVDTAMHDDIEESADITFLTEENDATADPVDSEQKDSTKAESKRVLELEATVAELEEKLTQLEALRETQSRMIEEIGDFSALFPDVDILCVPESVWEAVKKGGSLAASYALYERRLAAEAEKISRINAANAARSAGRAGNDTANEYFSPDEVRKMSRAEVHANYSKIKESMKKWI